MEIEIGGTLVGDDHPPFIVAEISANHGQSLEKAIALIHAAKKAGAHAIKFQTYTPKSMTVDSKKPPYLHSENSLWKNLSLYDLYLKASTPYEWFPTLFKEARKLGIIPFSSVFDAESVDFLEQFEPPCYKIATLEMIDHPLLKKVAKTNRPLIVSTGGATIQEVQEALDAIYSTGNRNVVLLKCVSAYPAPIQESNLATIAHMRSTFETLVGLSDHTTSNLTSILSVALGSCLIEKHFILSKEDKELDAAFSLDPEKLQQLVVDSKEAFIARGVIHYGPTLHEKDNFRFRRSLICTDTIEADETLTHLNVKSLRPNIGLEPKYLESVIGKKAKHRIEIGDPITWESI